jgi:hypothetical protein
METGESRGDAGLEECKRDLRGHLTEDDIKELIAWHLLWELARRRSTNVAKYYAPFERIFLRQPGL